MTSAEEIIILRNMELSAQSNIRNLWQRTADKLYPYANITTEHTPGSELTQTIFDETAMLDSEDMVSGLKQILIPSGQLFFTIRTAGRPVDNTQRYISALTEAAHDELFRSNFITEFDDILRSLIIFGPACLHSTWTQKMGLNYCAYPVGTFQIVENSRKVVDGIFITVKYTPRQAFDEFGDRAGKKVLEALNDKNSRNKTFEYIYYVAARQVNPTLSGNYSGNMAYESVVVNVPEKLTVSEGGYMEFPYHCGRWKRPSGEKDGRGIGTELLPQIKVLDKMMEDLIDVANKWVNPPREVLDNFEGTVSVKPGGVNMVSQMDSIKALDSGILGNFPVAKDILEMQHDIIHRAFFKNAFSPLEDLTGDRRTTLEIRERIRQTWHKIGPPVARIWYELLEPCITRSILLLIRNGVVPPPPQELAGQNFGIEFVGPFALELRSQQAKAFQEWVTFVGGLEEVFPGAVDNVDADDAIVRMGRTFGVNTEDIATEEERDAKRQKRAALEQAQLAAAAAETAGQAYGNTTAAPEEGSAAKKLMDAMGV